MGSPDSRIKDPVVPLESLFVNADCIRRIILDKVIAILTSIKVQYLHITFRRKMFIKSKSKKVVQCIVAKNIALVFVITFFFNVNIKGLESRIDHPESRVDYP